MAPETGSAERVLTQSARSDVWLPTGIREPPGLGRRPSTQTIRRFRRPHALPVTRSIDHDPLTRTDLTPHAGRLD